MTIFLLLSSLHPGNYLHGQEQPDTLSFYLPNILVTAIESKTPGTVSLLPASTLEHTQPITIADLTQLLPGGLTNNSGVTDAQYFSVREVSLKNGVNQFHKNAAMGAQIWVDGSPLHFNTGINEPYEGYDARFLSLNQVKEAEIIRGIPSARYGNPVQTANLKGETWSAYGDKRLNQNMMEYNEADDYRHIRVTEKHPYSLEKGDSYERETKVFYQVVTATCESIVEVWKAYQNALEGSGENILNEIPSERDDLPQFVYDRFPVIKDFPIPFGTDLDDVPLEASVADRKDELQLIVQEPFTRNFIRSRVANSFMFLIGTPIHSNRDGVMTYGGRLNVSMINWHKFGKGKGMIMEPGDIAHWVSPTISGYYMHAPSSSYTIKNWNVKAGANYNMDIFVSPKRFLGLYSYFEMGIDRRNDETRFLVAPSVGIQLGSLIGVHNFNMPEWLRIPLGIILPLKFAVTCNKVAGRPVEWISNMEVDILF